jgi:hypothetical protein
MKRKKALFTAEQLSLVLNISEFTVKKLARDGELPCKYVNRRPQFDVDALLKYFQKLEGGAA